jgi:soluble lytic murein transglycosylase-like protein
MVYGPHPHELKRPAPTPQPAKKAINKKQDNPVAKKIPDARHYPAKNYGTGEVQDLIRKYAQEYGISANTPLCIAKLESGFNPNAKNKSSSASGVFQWISSSWNSQPEGKQGLSVFDADANIRAAVRYMAEKKSTKPWVVNSKCPPVISL